MPTEIVLSETVLYSSLCTDNVTFISDQIAMLACWLHAPAREPCRLSGADASDWLVMCGLLVSHSLKQAQDIQVPY